MTVARRFLCCGSITMFWCAVYAFYVHIWLRFGNRATTFTEKQFNQLTICSGCQFGFSGPDCCFEWDFGSDCISS